MAELEPVDLKQCQSDRPGGGPFVVGGEVGDPLNGYRIRCKNIPTFVATERMPGDDGKCGAMSLCAECKKAFVKQLGRDYASFSKIEDSITGAALR